MAGLFSRLKVWSQGETVTATDLNNEFNNILSNVDSTHNEGYSQNLSQMQSTEDPGGLGTENLTQPISVSQELKRLRYAIKRLMGASQWYVAPSATLSDLNSSIAQAFTISPNRIVSGATSESSSQPLFLKALSSSGIRLLATSTNFNAYINSSLITVSADVSLIGLTSGPSSSNTATFVGSFSSNQHSKECDTFNVSGAGSEITSMIGKLACFKIVNGGNTEYFLGTPTSSSVISGVQRGLLFDTSNAAIPPIVITAGNTITILKLTYVFLKNDGTLEVSYGSLRYGSSTPSGGSIGDMWYDVSATQWKKYNGTSWAASNSLFIGLCAQDSSGNTVVSKGEEFYKQFSDVNTVVFDQATATVVSNSYQYNGKVSVYGTLLSFSDYGFSFDITANLVGGETEAASTRYYLYLSEIGKPWMTSIKPIYKRDLLGFYHPYEAWRCVASIYNNSSSDLDQSTLNVFSSQKRTNQTFTSTGTAAGYYFTVTAANASIGATYTNNGQTFTVLSTISGATSLYCASTGAPTSSGTLTKASGTGDATITFSASQAMATYLKPVNCKSLKVAVMGSGGGGGGGSGTSGTAGKVSFFGLGYVLSNGGSVGSHNGSIGGAGGTPSVNYPAINILSLTGATGGRGMQGITAYNSIGGSGGVSPFGGAGACNFGGNTGETAQANSGSGGGGGGGYGGYGGPSGGGAGAYCIGQFNNPSNIYYYSLGSAGVGGALDGTYGGAGGNAAVGQIIVEEDY